jgi:hypothetical protein
LTLALRLQQNIAAQSDEHEHTHPHSLKHTQFPWDAQKQSRSSKTLQFVVLEIINLSPLTSFAQGLL